jgi:coenzyme Q-binding protein COQ10
MPYCLSSTVTRYSDPPTNARPSEADLRVGWGSYDETFRSAVNCEPEQNKVSANASQNSIFEKLSAQWEVVGKEEGTDVSLHVEFQFVNPIYAMVSQAVVPKISAMMIEAFEKRANEVLKARNAGERQTKEIGNKTV